MSSSSHNSNQGNLRKSKLDQIWNDLQTNLPQINFDDDSNDLVKILILLRTFRFSSGFINSVKF